MILLDWYIYVYFIRLCPTLAVNYTNLLKSRAKSLFSKGKRTQRYLNRPMYINGNKHIAIFCYIQFQGRSKTTLWVT